MLLCEVAKCYFATKHESRALHTPPQDAAHMRTVSVRRPRVRPITQSLRPSSSSVPLLSPVCVFLCVLCVLCVEKPPARLRLAAKRDARPRRPSTRPSYSVPKSLIVPRSSPFPSLCLSLRALRALRCPPPLAFRRRPMGFGGQVGSRLNVTTPALPGAVFPAAGFSSNAIRVTRLGHTCVTRSGDAVRFAGKSALR